jgi:hypothetical protein
MSQVRTGERRIESRDGNAVRPLFRGDFRVVKGFLSLTVVVHRVSATIAET